MALRNLKSKLAVGGDEALTYGKGRAYDRPNQGFSNEPFIKGGINLGGTTGFNSLTGGFIRGGALMHLERTIQDTARIGKFILSGRGITFIAKQIGLQKANPKISEPSVGGILGSPANQRTYNFGLNTLAQVVGQGTGLHIKREGSSPLSKSGYQDEDKFLENYQGKPTFSGKSKNTNKLLYLYDTNINTDPAQERFKKAMVMIGGVLTEVPFANRFNYSALSSPLEAKQGKPSRFGKFAKNIGQKIKAAFANPNKQLYSYKGGPGSTYGIGQTDIYKYTNTNPKDTLRYYSERKNIGFFAEDENDINGIFSVNNILFERPSADDLEQLTQNKTYIDKFGNLRDENKEKNWGEGGNNIITDDTLFDSHILNGKTRVKNYLFTTGRISEDNYSKTRSDKKSYHREERVNLGNPGSNPLADGNTTVDLINAIDLFKSSGDFADDAIRDLIRFRIEAVNPYNTSQTDVMVFRAFLDSMNDNFNASYNEFNYNGRGESFYTYNSFNRSIDFSFKIAAQSSKEMKPLYRKLNYLLSNTAPEYHETSGRMMTPFMRLTIGSYFDRLPGIITNVGVTWQKDYPWEITLDAPEGGSTSGLFVLPHVLDINISYQPIHDFLPQKSSDTEQSPFIVPHKDSPASKGYNNSESNSEKVKKTWNSDPVVSTINLAKTKIAK